MILHPRQLCLLLRDITHLVVVVSLSLAEAESQTFIELWSHDSSVPELLMLVERH